jgi:hypothetical protein
MIVCSVDDNLIIIAGKMIIKEVSVPNQKKKRIECVSETDDEQYKKKKRNLKRLTLQFSKLVKKKERKNRSSLAYVYVCLFVQHLC